MSARIWPLPDSAFVRTRRLLAVLLASVLLLATPVASSAAEQPTAEFIDLSLLVAPELPSIWPINWPLQINHYLRIGPLSAYNSDVLVIDPNTGTQFDVPTHSVAAPDSGLPAAGVFGLAFTNNVPAWQFAGEACVIDTRTLLGKGKLGHSSLIQKEHVTAWEKQHRTLSFGDVVLFRSGYSDLYYRPLPEGRKFIAEALEGKVPGWPDPGPETLDYLGAKGVMAAGTDSPSMGPIPDLAEPTHVAGLKHGMIWTESGTGFDRLPTTGAFYCVLGPKHKNGVASEARAFAVVGSPLAPWLIEAARGKRALDLSVVLSEDLPVSWAGVGVGNHRQPYKTINVSQKPSTGYYEQTHIMDSHAGTHLVPPAYALPPPGFNNGSYSADVQKILADYEATFGSRGTSDITVEKVPLSQTSGWARVVDVRHLIGTTKKEAWPTSPEITAEVITDYEKKAGPLKAGEIVLFRSGYNEAKCLQAPFEACMSEPLNGKAEGWPALGPSAVLYLAQKGIRCVGSDGPTIGGADFRHALKTYWAMGSKGVVGVEYLIRLGDLPGRSYFLFAAPKVKGSHGGPGRAIALH